jgi:hypothetical protein
MFASDHTRPALLEEQQRNDNVQWTIYRGRIEPYWATERYSESPPNTHFSNI